MTPNEWQKFCVMLDDAADMIGQPRRTEGAKGLMFTILGRFELRDVASALSAHVAESKFFPAPSELIQRIEGSASDRAMVAFQVVRHNLNTYVSVQFDDPLIHYTVAALGGWQKFGEILEDDLKWLEKDFCRYYEHGARQRKTWGEEGVPHSLMGRHEAHNRLAGQPVEPPLTITTGMARPALPAHTTPRQLTAVPMPALRSMSGAA